ncbi:LysR family transcriptional regulator [Mesosutterella sp. AGMB02718]|uniref:LysR family transcriptional regulator n=1 Tax=Mesosutterella faecium TaxID=2925194 RepID=A0ABT7IPK1_9BURK|nr:LysR family transcriptional regulator [Mesosutterella sp. AGMB02718]MDL2060299.1 LysR family transcriptional regulator [Mesosutterella sp. AGMB02718]
MLDYEEMRYLVEFSRLGTLSEVAKRCHISQPTVTRAMKKAEEEIGVSLFEHRRNRLDLNENGRLAASELQQLLQQWDEAYRRVREFDRSHRVISIGSCAAVQIPGLVARLSQAAPDAPISTETAAVPDLTAGLEAGRYRLVVLPFRPKDPELYSEKVGSEQLMLLVPPEHRLAGRASVALKDLEGETMLLYTHIGFWSELVRNKMPGTRFLLQSDRRTLLDLIARTGLPAFTTDIANLSRSLEGRVCVPFSDPEARADYYLVCRRDYWRQLRL